MAQYLILRDRLEQAVGQENLKDHLVFTTDPKVGVLRDIANKDGIQTFSIPPTAGGRFSIFSPVGLLPAALVGIPIKELTDGLKEINQNLKNTDIFKNPAAQAALLEFDAYKRGKNMSVLMPYSQKLAAVADWYVQLWSESLGKMHNNKGEQIFAGQTPIKAVGATDQHSQAQLFNAGPFDKVVNFIRLAKFKNPLAIPKQHADKETLSYLGGKNVEQLMQAEFEGTRSSLNLHQRPNTTLTLPENNPKYFAQLLQFFMFKTAVMAELLEINGYDQPNVELGKQITYGIMGRKGYEKFKA
jgi:glucose-6-phosphate isomerase